MSKKKTDDEVKAEIAALTDLAMKLPGSRKKIEAQIDVLQNRLSNDDVYDRFEGSSVFDDANDVRMWRDGDSGSDPMSVQWQELL